MSTKPNKMKTFCFLSVYLAASLGSGMGEESGNLGISGLKVFRGYISNYDDASINYYGNRLNWGNNETIRNRNDILYGQSYCRNPFTEDTEDRGYCYQRLIVNTKDDPGETFFQILGSYQVIETGEQEETAHRVGVQIATPPLQDVIVHDGEAWSETTNQWGYGYLHFIVNVTTQPSLTDTFSSQSHSSQNRQLTNPESWHYGRPLPSSVREKVAEFRCWTAQWGMDSIRRMYIWRFNDTVIPSAGHNTMLTVVIVGIAVVVLIGVVCLATLVVKLRNTSKTRNQPATPIATMSGSNGTGFRRNRLPSPTATTNGSWDDSTRPNADYIYHNSDVTYENE